MSSENPLNPYNSPEWRNVFEQQRKQHDLQRPQTGQKVSRRRMLTDGAIYTASALALGLGIKSESRNRHSNAAAGHEVYISQDGHAIERDPLDITFVDGQIPLSDQQLAATTSLDNQGIEFSYYPVMSSKRKTYVSLYPSKGVPAITALNGTVQVDTSTASAFQTHTLTTLPLDIDDHGNVAVMIEAKQRPQAASSETGITQQYEFHYHLPFFSRSNNLLIASMVNPNSDNNVKRGIDNLHEFALPFEGLAHAPQIEAYITPDDANYQMKYQYDPLENPSLGLVLGPERLKKDWMFSAMSAATSLVSAHCFDNPKLGDTAPDLVVQKERDNLNTIIRHFASQNKKDKGGMGPEESVNPIISIFTPTNYDKSFFDSELLSNAVAVDDVDKAIGAFVAITKYKSDQLLDSNSDFMYELTQGTDCRLLFTAFDMWVKRLFPDQNPEHPLIPDLPELEAHALLSLPDYYKALHALPNYVEN